MTDCCLILRVRCEFTIRESLHKEEILRQCFIIAFRTIVSMPDLQLRTATCLLRCPCVIDNSLQRSHERIDIDLFTGIFNSSGFNQVDMSECLENELIVTGGIFIVCFVGELQDEGPFFRIVLLLCRIAIGECQAVIRFNSVGAIGIIGDYPFERRFGGFQECRIFRSGLVIAKSDEVERIVCVFTSRVPINHSLILNGGFFKPFLCTEQISEFNLCQRTVVSIGKLV